MVTGELVIIVPGLLGPYHGIEQLPDSDWPPLPCLQRLLSRADREPAQHHKTEFYSLLFSLTGLSFDPHADLPLAALALVGEGESPEQHCWLRMDPVHLRADRTEAVLVAHEALQLTAEETVQLQASIKPLLTDFAAELFFTEPQHWYLRLSECPQLTTTPLLRAMGKPVRELLPQGNDRIVWHRLINEIQMTWHEHPVNQQREQQGKLAVNGVWPWGAGQLPYVETTKVDVICSSDPVLAGLAHQLGAEHVSLASVADLPKQASQSRHGTSWWVEDRWALLQESQDISGWLAALKEFESNVAAPCCELLKQKDLRIRFKMHARHDFVVTRKALRRWWRRNRPLKSFMVP